MARPHSLGEGKVTKSTEKAFLIELDDADDGIWIPKSVIHDDSEVYDDADNSTGEVVVHEWWAEKNGHT